MQIQNSNQNISTIDKALGITLAAFSMFVVGYTATRVYLSQPSEGKISPNHNEEFVIPHQATLWSVLGE